MRQLFVLPLLALALVAQEPTPPAKPTAQRDAAGTVTLTCATPGVVIRYSVDGSDPGPKGGPYLAPIVLPAGGTVKARAYTEDRKVKSDLVEAKFDALPGAKALPATLVPCTQDRDFPIYDWAKRHAAVTKLTTERQASLVFIGDSITQMFGGAPHGWLNDTMPGRYRPKETEMAWKLILDFIERVHAGAFPKDRMIWRFESDAAVSYDFTKKVRLA